MSAQETSPLPPESIPLDQLKTQPRTADSLPLEPAREVWLQEEWKPFRRMVIVADRLHINVMLQCKGCEQMIQFKDGKQGVEMVCGCKRRVIQ